MKTAKLLAACLLTLLSSHIHAQWVTIPDTMFVAYLQIYGMGPCLQGDNTNGWYLDAGCTQVQQMESMNVSGAGITDLTGVEYFNLDTLICNTAGTSITQLPPNLLYLDVSLHVGTGSFTNLPPLPATLTALLCGNNLLTALPALPVNLAFLDCANNLLTALPALPAGLQHLYCMYNQITALPALPAGLMFLDCNSNPITALPGLPANMIFMGCGTCQLTALPALPVTLQTLECYDNQLTALPTLPPNLYTLICHINQLTALPVLPASLLTLNCARNQLTTLPVMPNGIDELVYANNPVTVAPVINNPAMKRLDCSYTPISSIPALPTRRVDYFSCEGTNLTTLPTLPDTLGSFSIKNTAISCLPQLKLVRWMYLTNSNITCLPNYPLQNITCEPPLNSLSLCDIFNANACPVYWNISGSVYNDLNGNCTMDVAETQLKSVCTQLWQNGTLLQQFVSSQGFYSFDVAAYGTYQVTVDTANIPFTINCPGSGSFTSVISAADSFDSNMDFALACKNGFDLQARSVWSDTHFRPANYTTVLVSAGDASSFYNAHCTAGVSGTVTLTYSGPAHFVTAVANALVPTVTGNTLTWNVADFGTSNLSQDFNFTIQTDTTAQAGQQVCFTLSITTPTSGDNNPANNTFSICYTVVNSFDPNDKAVYPAGNIDTTQRDLVYTIRFQNTGNAEAQHIYITDTLSSSINPASFQLLAYSHAPMVQLDGNKLRFNFPNINLPDSTTNEPASHGYVQFKVKLNNGLPVGTVINNTAFIYFDFNAPVITNTATNTIYVPAPPVLKPVSIGKYRIDRAVKPNGRL